MSLQAAIIDYLTRHLGPIPTMWAYAGIIIVGWWVMPYLYRKRMLVRV